MYRRVKLRIRNSRLTDCLVFPQSASFLSAFLSPSEEDVLINRHAEIPFFQRLRSWSVPFRSNRERKRYPRGSVIGSVRRTPIRSPFSMSIKIYRPRYIVRGFPRKYRILSNRVSLSLSFSFSLSRKGQERDCVRGRNTILRNGRAGQDMLAVFLY